MKPAMNRNLLEPPVKGFEIVGSKRSDPSSPPPVLVLSKKACDPSSSPSDLERPKKVCTGVSSQPPSDGVSSQPLSQSFHLPEDKRRLLSDLAVETARLVFSKKACLDIPDNPTSPLPGLVLSKKACLDIPVMSTGRAVDPRGQDPRLTDPSPTPPVLRLVSFPPEVALASPEVALASPSVDMAPITANGVSALLAADRLMSFPALPIGMTKAAPSTDMTMAMRPNTSISDVIMASPSDSDEMKIVDTAADKASDEMKIVDTAADKASDEMKVVCTQASPPGSPVIDKASDEMKVVCTQASPPASPIRMRSPSEIESRFVDPKWSPAKIPYKKRDAATAFDSPPAVCEPTTLPALQKKARRLPIYMTEDCSSVRKLVYDISDAVVGKVDELCLVKEQIYGVEVDEFYRFYLDGEIDSISCVYDNIVITSTTQLLDIYKIMREFVSRLCEKVEKLFTDARGSLYDMPVHRTEWAEYAQDEAKNLMLAINEDMQKLESDEIVV
jgi:hypothetical protein